MNLTTTQNGGKKMQSHKQNQLIDEISNLKRSRGVAEDLVQGWRRFVLQKNTPYFLLLEAKEKELSKVEGNWQEIDGERVFVSDK